MSLLRRGRIKIVLISVLAAIGCKVCNADGLRDRLMREQADSFLRAMPDKPAI